MCYTQTDFQRLKRFSKCSSSAEHIQFTEMEAQPVPGLTRGIVVRVCSKSNFPLKIRVNLNKSRELSFINMCFHFCRYAIVLTCWSSIAKDYWASFTVQEHSLYSLKEMGQYLSKCCYLSSCTIQCKHIWITCFC